MALYTRAGDDGTTRTFSCDQRISKSSTIAEALGSLDEVNSFLGLCKTGAAALELSFNGRSIPGIVHEAQEALFIVQAELAGAEGKTIAKKRVEEVEGLVDSIENILPTITTFFIAGGTPGLTGRALDGAEIAARFDAARTIARRAERRVVAVVEEGKVMVGAHSLAYLNRLSSLLYALARFSNHAVGVSETAPRYK